jgi:hypothetical protein
MKKAKKKLKKSKGKRKTKPDPNVEETYWDTISFFCPIKKKMVKQRIQVKKYKSLGDILKNSRSIVLTPDPLADLEKEDDGLNIYGITEETDE